MWSKTKRKKICHVWCDENSPGRTTAKNLCYVNNVLETAGRGGTRSRYGNPGKVTYPDQKKEKKRLMETGRSVFRWGWASKAMLANTNGWLRSCARVPHGSIVVIPKSWDRKRCRTNAVYLAVSFQPWKLERLTLTILKSDFLATVESERTEPVRMCMPSWCKFSIWPIHMAGGWPGTLFFFCVFMQYMMKKKKSSLASMTRDNGWKYKNT